MTSAVPARPRLAVPSRLTAFDWDILFELIETYGVDELVRSIRLWQMTTILNLKHEEPSGEEREPRDD